MALDVNRWLKYAKARIDSAVGQGNSSLDRLEAEREAEVADKPWLRSDGDAPTLDEARARIQWEAQRQAAVAEGHAGAASTTGPGPKAAPALDPQDQAAAAEAQSARLQLEAQERASAERLDAIRRELGVDAPVEPADEGPAKP
ncbi:hypothetical protein BH10ACT1_BH10ACT1_39340 [soil metagenome]